ncbi:hypothetical protein LENED_009219 [Lentinula edodes]|uniref:Uncharacterized protein n=1 Tax=Lentinula edodes TaxID=5353 RepID=A0A1Q3EJ72_LENED|nr:hypothetical protein LENED_009219 [Lentinula edodes]
MFNSFGRCIIVRIPHTITIGVALLVLCCGMYRRNIRRRNCMGKSLGVHYGTRENSTSKIYLILVIHQY